MAGLLGDVRSSDTVDIHGFWTLVEATLIVWAVNFALDLTPGPWQITGRRRRRYRHA